MPVELSGVMLALAPERLPADIERRLTDFTDLVASAISQARTRLGEAPLKLLFQRISAPMARPGTRGAWFHGLRMMAIDGLVLDVPDTPTNDEEFGRSSNDKTPGPFPQVRLVALGECGTHAVVDAELGGVSTGERTLAATLIARFAPGMLVLADRNFYSYQAWHIRPGSRQ